MQRSIVTFLISVALLAGCQARHSSEGLVVENDSASTAKSAPAQGSQDVPALKREEAILDSQRHAAQLAQRGQQGQQGQQGQDNLQKVSLAAAQAIQRKIIRNAQITLETDTPDEGQQKISSIAEKHGGYVVVSESSQSEAKTQTAAAATVNVVVRVPAQEFDAAIEEIRGVAAPGGRILYEKRSGQDVTEEYIDLEARLRAKRALEAQFLEIMKQAHKVSDALEVQTQLTNVRTEIEQIEGRRRFLENQSALSTINITLRTPAPVVAATTRGFFHELKTAFGDGVDTAADIFLSIVRFVILMVPVTLFILLPCWLVFKWLRRRIAWPSRAPATSAPGGSGLSE